MIPQDSLNIQNDSLKKANMPTLKDDVQNRYSKDNRYNSGNTSDSTVLDTNIKVPSLFENTSVNSSIIEKGLAEVASIKTWDELDDLAKEQFTEQLIKEYKDKGLYDASFFNEDFIKKIYNQTVCR